MIWNILNDFHDMSDKIDECQPTVLGSNNYKSLENIFEYSHILLLQLNLPGFKSDGYFDGIPLISPFSFFFSIEKNIRESEP